MPLSKVPIARWSRSYHERDIDDNSCQQDHGPSVIRYIIVLLGISAFNDSNDRKKRNKKD
jgi:hypothetical protein